MAQYRVLKDSFIGNSLVKEGDVVDYDGTPGDNLEPVDKAAKAAAKVAAKAEADAALVAQAEADAQADAQAAAALV